MTKDQITALLLSVFGAAGPLSKILATLFHLDDKTIDAILDTGTVLTPIVAGAYFTYMHRPSGIIAIAETTPGVATVVVKDTATNGLAKLAQDEGHPNIVTETQNEADAKQGTKVP